MASSYYLHGSYNAICDRCGFEYKSGQLRKEWTGLRVCSTCFEVRHPQDFVRGKPDRQAPPWVRPEPPEIYLAPGDVRAEDL